MPNARRAERSGLQTVLSLLPYLWPTGNTGARIRVSIALVFMLAAKLATVYVPILYGRAVDALAPTDATAMVALPVALIVGYGLVRVAAAGFGEIRDALFASVQQRAVRKIALRTFRHLH
ncbi:MAG: metal ABC transporter permease, partial [Rhodospirillales bacterium]|nr:metal ABC transporter permease [Rhodospirillales bacterium]